MVSSREHRLRGRWGQKSHRKHIGCLHTCNEHTLVQPILLHPYTPYTPYTGALAYTTTLHEPTNTQPYTILQTPTQPYKRITQSLHAYPTYIPCPYKPTKPYIPTLPLHTYPTPTYLHYPYNPYNTTHPMLFTAYWPCPCTHAQ